MIWIKYGSEWWLSLCYLLNWKYVELLIEKNWHVDDWWIGFELWLVNAMTDIGFLILMDLLTILISCDIAKLVEMWLWLLWIIIEIRCGCEMWLNYWFCDELVEILILSELLSCLMLNWIFDVWERLWSLLVTIWDWFWWLLKDWN